MLFARTTFIGIDPTAGDKPFAYAALDRKLENVAIGYGEMAHVLAFVAGQEEAFVAVCAPRQPSQGVMDRPEVRQNLSPPPKPGRWAGFRLVDYLLRQHNLRMPRVSPRAKECPRWMQVGFALHNKLAELGYSLYPGEGAVRQTLEVYPLASFAALIGVRPLPKASLEGQLQRQLALYENNVHVHDPMRFFEEITRHRLLRGALPREILRTPAELDALVAAYTAWKAATHPHEVSLIGDPQEGQIVLPVSSLKERY